jgi:hypothetical protein
MGLYLIFAHAELYEATVLDIETEFSRMERNLKILLFLFLNILYNYAQTEYFVLAILNHLLASMKIDLQSTYNIYPQEMNLDFLNQLEKLG